MRIRITDITEMHQGNYCVAGWDPLQRNMVRPLPNGANWTAALLAKCGIVSGVTIQVRATGANPNSVYPHKTEDMPIEPSSIELISPGPEPWFDANSPPTSASLAEAFGGHLQTTGEWNSAKKGAYVREGTRTVSLAAVHVERDGFEFFEDNYKGKRSLRAYLRDDSQRYSLPVVAKALREPYRASGSAYVNQILPEKGVLHVRVGLARAWSGQPEKCTVMINGVYW